MSSNNALSCYSSYYGCPAVYCNPCSSHYTNFCQPICNPCQPICNINPSLCNPCPQPCPPQPCLNVTYITTAPTATTVPTGGTPIPVGSTTVPAGTVTVITGFSGIPSTNVGGISVSNGQFTIPSAGRYFISGTVCFVANATGSRTLYIYRIDATTGLISQLAANTVPAISATVPTCVNASTAADLNAGDRLFFAVTQTSGANLDTTTTAENRFVITRLC